MRNLIVFVVFAAAIGCGGDARVDGITQLDGDATSGEDLYRTQCASCHGADGRGGSASTDITGEAKRPSTIAKTVLNGKSSMPAFDTVFTDQDVADIIAYVGSW